MSLVEHSIRVLDEWYAGRPLYKNRLPSKGSVAAALHVLNRLRSSYTLDIRAHLARGKAQIRGLSAKSLRAALAEFGETRALSSIAGRSNRGVPGDVESLLDAMRPLRLESESDEARKDVLKSMRRHIVTAFISRHFAAGRVRAVFDPAAATAGFIDALLESARMDGKAGDVAEYLVGAKLACRFPEREREIRNKVSSDSDDQAGFSGDFEFGRTVFHVTTAPMQELYQKKLKESLERGLRVYLLVPRSLAVGVQQNVSALYGNRIAVEPIESFVATNVDEISGFEPEKLKSGLRRLLEKYNERVDEVELDKSMLIEIPPNLR